MALNGVDPAIVEALKLDPDTAKMTTHGGSGFASTFKLVGTVTGGDGKQEQRTFFVKTGSGADAQVMFRGEHASLNAIHDAVPGFCPRSHAHGAMAASPGRFFLATDFLDLGGGGAEGTSLAAKLAKLHTTPAPPGVMEDGAQQQAMFGFPVPTCCGSTAQENGWRASWADFYADNRLRAILRAGVRANGADAELERAVEATAAKVVPRLLGDGHLRGVFPVVCHGDLWSGNHGIGRIVGGPEKGERRTEAVVFDPSAVYGHSEYDLGIMKMFGGFGAAFWREYGELVPKSEPVKEYDDRIALYELYHHLNHFAIFGGGYRAGAMSIMKRLLSKYG